MLKTLFFKTEQPNSPKNVKTTQKAKTELTTVNTLAHV